MLEWLKNLNPWSKTLSVVLLVFLTGWSSHVVFSQQIGLPAIVQENSSRLHNVESRLDLLQDVVVDISVLYGKVEAVNVLAGDTYCLVRAHALGLDPLVECTLAERRRR